jgi:two-component system CheB/CheR fusion protein
MLTKQPRATLTIWSAGCATGEEAYSAAATAIEACTDLASRPLVRVIATDVSPSVLVTGRLGRMLVRGPLDIPQAARRYFRETAGSVVASNDLRRRIVFRHHDLLKDDPIEDVDLVICRNTLMYFSVAAQRRILEGFAAVLPEDGLLFTGTAELPSVWSNRFAPISLAARVWRKTPACEAGGGKRWDRALELQGGDTPG